MVFDEKLSSGISLSRILDYFLEVQESPRTILDFLDMYKSRIQDILIFSDHSPRLFSLDFIYRCSLADVHRLAGFMEMANGLDEVEQVVWTVMSCKDVPQDVKKEFGKYHAKHLASIVHPYGGPFGRVLEEMDMRIGGWGSTAITYADAINSLDDMNCLTRIASSVRCATRRSLYADRVFQTDVFMHIDPIKQFVLLSSLPRGGPWRLPIHKSMKQILEYPSNADMKRMVCHAVHGRSEDLRMVLDAAAEAGISMDVDTVPLNKFLMKLQISGDERLLDWLFYYMLVHRGLKFISECGSNGMRLLEKYFNISDLVP